jgi:hypothetical protein
MAVPCYYLLPAAALLPAVYCCSAAPCYAYSLLLPVIGKVGIYGINLLYIHSDLIYIYIICLFVLASDGEGKYSISGLNE